MNKKPSLLQRKIPTEIGIIIIGIVAAIFIFGVIFYRYWYLEKLLEDFTSSYQTSYEDSSIT